MKDRLNSLTEQGKTNNLDARPIFFRLKKSEDKAKLEKLISENSSIQAFDEIMGQVEEFVKSKHPKKVFSKPELAQAAIDHVGNTPLHEYGVWVFYPWSKRLVHILDEEEFVVVRTNRNQYKITPEEKKTLASKKIGIIGLSVGQSIALTIAMERGCGEMRLADFDLLEMSNLNRIRAGVHSLGIPKTTVAAREIMEIDPYMKVSCYPEGLTEENADDFFCKDGKLDVCIEVCDGLYAKIFARWKAKQYRVAVVMNSSDRGTTDVERYDLDPEQPILHGLIDHLDLSLVKNAKTNEEKVPYLLPMLGVTTSTDRLRASMLEIQETITTWPQLASGVILGGGICADVCRRILLNQMSKSGRWFVDLEDLINDNIPDFIETSRSQPEIIELIPNSSIEHYRDEISEFENKHTNLQSETLNHNQINELVTAASLAPSGGNIQPWKWVYKKQLLYLFNDINRTESVLNYGNSANYIALGAATENLILKSQESGYDISCQKFPLGKNKKLVAVFSFIKASDKIPEGFESRNNLQLAKAIPLRVTNRRLGKRELLELKKEVLLKDVVKTVPGAELQLFKGEQELNDLKEIICAVDKLYLTSKIGNFTFSNELRWTDKETEKTRDGIDIKTLDITPTELAGLLVSKEWRVTKFINEWETGDAFTKLSKKAIDSSSALGLITMPKVDTTTFYDGGRAVQKVWLSCTSESIAFQPMSILIFLFTRVKDGNFDGIEEIKDELLHLHHRFTNICSLKSNRKEMFLFRLSNADEPSVKALRRPLEDILIHE